MAAICTLMNADAQVNYSHPLTAFSLSVTNTVGIPSVQHMTGCKHPHMHQSPVPLLKKRTHQCLIDIL